MKLGREISNLFLVRPNLKFLCVDMLSVYILAFIKFFFFNHLLGKNILFLSFVFICLNY